MIKLRARMLLDAPVRYTARADRLAGAALQAQLPVSLDRRRELAPALSDEFRHVDAPARRFNLEAGDEVCRARAEAETAVHAAAQVVFRRRFRE